MVDPCILHTETFKQIADDFASAIKEGSTYIFDTCWESEQEKSVTKLKPLMYLIVHCDCQLPKTGTWAL